MRCNEFDTFIDEMLSGVLYPEASQHMRKCERCTSHFRARATVQNGLRQLAAANLPGPSSATDRAVMEAYRLFQRRQAAAGNSGSAAGAVAAPAARVFTFPSRSLASMRSSRAWWSGAAAAAIVVAVLGSAVHLWNGVPTVNAPVAINAPAAPAMQQRLADASLQSTVAVGSAARRPTRALPVTTQANAGQKAHRSNLSVLEIATAGFRPQPTEVALNTRGKYGSQGRSGVAYEASNHDSAPVTKLPANFVPVVLATSGASGGVAQPASSTWPGYSNLMYCDPVVCSGPMQVVHIKVPVGEGKPSSGQSLGNGFVGADVVVGPDGVARAIRVAN